MFDEGEDEESDSELLNNEDEEDDEEEDDDEDDDEDDQRGGVPSPHTGRVGLFSRKESTVSSIMMTIAN